LQEQQLAITRLLSKSIIGPNASPSTAAVAACRDKIKVENMGPISYCGGAPPKAAAKKAAAPGATTEVKKNV
jgi:hypothetical protein